jgi:prepilin-type N-terminal cleavage/methylation domain-containing protein
MRKGLSLIELIFTIVIIALVFTVIPKIVFALKKSDSFAIRQDAILNSVSLMQMLSKLPWDQNDFNTTDILHVNAGNVIFDCNTTTMLRQGGFVGSRNCQDNLNALGLGSDVGENNETNFNDIDDFNNFDFNTSIYNIHLTVNYVNDFAVAPLIAPPSITIDLSTNGLAAGSTNLKRVNLQTNYNGVRVGERGNALMNFSYTSANIGQTFLHKRVWQ